MDRTELPVNVMLLAGLDTATWKYFAIDRLLISVFP
jgi:hypothetical protein